MTATLAGIARESGAQVCVIDALITGQSQQEVVEELANSNADWIGIMPYEYRRAADRIQHIPCTSH